MECTQRLECTQEVNGSPQEKSFPEQIGFLGICGTKYPVKKGPNKIGRDPQTCNIVLNLNSVSRQHAVINILNDKEYMIMDLDSANKTRLLDKTLPPYIPQPLKNGDTVQFGQIFGVFRLLEEDNDLPMTQALEIPETPIVNRHISKLNNFATTTIPESPDVNDKDESFIVASQHKNEIGFKSPNNHFIKPGRAIAIQPVGTNKIDNIYWNSSKKSASFEMHLDDSGDDIVETPLKSTDIVSNKSIYEMDTQVPFLTEQNQFSDAIYNANTQLPSNISLSSNTSTSETNLPKNDNLPEIQKIHNQLEMKLDLFVENKENNNCIYNAETQQFVLSKEEKEGNTGQKIDQKVAEALENAPKKSLNISDEEILFDEVDNEPFQDDFESQPIILEAEILDSKETNTSVNKNNGDQKLMKRRVRINSDSSTDCEDFDMLPTQKIQDNQNFTSGCKENVLITDKLRNKNTLNILENLKTNDDSTDCEDNLLETRKKVNQNAHDKPDDDDSTDCEDDIIPCNSNAIIKKDDEWINFENMAIDRPNEADNIKNKTVSSDLEFEDMPTQVIEEINIQNDSMNIGKSAKESSFEDLPTQLLEVESPTEVFKQNEIAIDKSPFKVPMSCFKKSKRKEVNKSTNLLNKFEEKKMKNRIMDDDNFYEATQDIFNDLCSQKDTCSDIKQLSTDIGGCGIITLSSEEKELITRNFGVDISSESTDEDHKINRFVTNLSNQQVKDIIGVEGNKITKVKKTLSDNSDIDITPKKLIPHALMETELPNSQEIKTSVTLSSRTLVTDSSSESDTEHDSQDQFTPILFRKNKKNKSAKLDLSKKFEVEKLPSRIITRVRKPSAKLLNSDMNSKNTAKNILKPKFITEQEENIDKEIITENISRLKGKTDKRKNGSDGGKSDSNKKCDEQNNSKHVKSDTNNLPKNTQNQPVNVEKISEKKKDDKLYERKQIETKKNSREHFKKHKINDHKKTDIIKNDDKTTSDKSLKTSREALERSDKLEKSRKEFHKARDSTELLTRSEAANELSNPKVNQDDINQTSKEEVSVTRSRTRRKKNDCKDEIKCTNKETKDKTKLSENGDKRKRSYEDQNHNNSSAVKEIRRSKRQRTVKNNLEVDIELCTKSNSKKNKPLKHEQSTVYGIHSISSESGRDSPNDKSFKRPSKDEVVVNVKKTRSETKSDDSTSLRSTPRNIKTHRVLFTAFPSDEVKGKLEKWGAVIVTDVTTCTVLLTVQIKRTFKLLCAVGLGRPIVGLSWVQACHDTKMIVDPWNYLIKDEATEKRFQFNLEQTLSGKRNFLKGYNVSSTPNVMPSAMEMKLIVECSGGTWKEEGPKWICVSCSADKSLWPALKRKGATIVSTEFILGGVLRQKLDINGNKLA
ncbi:unnamed protein product [Parnassius apollo]|uniref:Mediator of DNA damage checkpoint protein 1 n=1 Tax=Parnassius apollo TaxID=110799 RepID=A0A8S3XXG4_PARAO|nr:unnamed protein product [Parnassius apollo]